MRFFLKIYDQIYFLHLDPVVQSIVFLTRSLVKDLLCLLVHTQSSMLIFFAEKMLQKFLTIFLQKNGIVFAFGTFEILTTGKLTASLVLNNWVVLYNIKNVDRNDF